MNSKAQTSLEFIVLIGIILLFSFYFSSAIYSSSQINKSIHLVKQRSLDLLSKNNSRSLIESINIDLIDANIDLTVNILKKDDFEFNEDDFEIVSSNIVNSSSYAFANIYFNYN